MVLLILAKKIKVTFRFSIIKKKMQNMFVQEPLPYRHGFCHFEFFGFWKMKEVTNFVTEKKK